MITAILSKAKSILGLNDIHCVDVRNCGLTNIDNLLIEIERRFRNRTWLQRLVHRIWRNRPRWIKTEGNNLTISPEAQKAKERLIKSGWEVS